MKRWQRLSLTVLVAVLAAACASDNSARNLPFSEGWRHEERRDAEMRRRQERIGEGRLFGRKDGTHAAVSGGEDGTKLRVQGKENGGMQLDVGYDSGPEAEVGYKYQWDFARPRRGSAAR